MIPSTSADLLPQGLALDKVDKGAFIQNMFRRRNAWEVRAGFGQVSQFDTTLLAPNSGARGYTRQLGSYALKTWWGATQIVTVLLGNAATANTSARSHSIDYYAVSIYDTDTGKRWEEILHRHSGEAGSDSILRPPYWRGQYQTSQEWDRQNWLLADPEDKHVFFAPFNNDTLLFGNVNMGLWYYSPADYEDTRWQQVDGVRRADHCLPYMESSRVARIFPQNGIFEDATRYLDSSTFPVPTDVVMLDNRAYIAQDRSVFISDVGAPNSVAGVNVLDVPCIEPITALGEAAGVLLIWTQNETFAYRPSVGLAAASGDLRRLSDNVGCLGPMSKARMDQALVWADMTGIYSFNGGLEITNLGQPLQPLFESEEQISLPLSSFYANDGQADTSYSQPLSFLRWSADSSIHLEFDGDLQMLFVSIPESNAVLVNSRGAWSVWTTESLASEAATRVEARRNLPHPHVCARDGRIFMVCGPESATASDAITPAENYESSSYFITEWGRGGAIDRTVDSREDMRKFNGYYETSLTGREGYIVFAEPQVLPSSFKLPTVTANRDVYLLPVLFMPDASLGGSSSAVDIRFTFDNTQWSPLFSPATPGQVDFMLPAERSPSLDGWGWNAPAAGMEVRCYSGGVVDETGNEIRMIFNGAAAAATWSRHPNMIFSGHRIHGLMWLPFARVSSGQDAMSMGIQVTTATIDGTDHDHVVWHIADTTLKHGNNDVAQPVDWVLKTERVEDANRSQLRMRNVVMRLLTHGVKATETVGNAWPQGLINIAFQADWRDWSGQVSDMASYNKIFGKIPLRDRMVDAAGAVTDRIFNNAAKWGQSGTANGNFLVDDEQLDTQGVSSSLRGESLAVMVFGHVKSRAEKVVVDSLRAYIKVVGKPRRWGR